VLRRSRRVDSVLADAPPTLAGQDAVLGVAVIKGGFKRGRGMLLEAGGVGFFAQSWWDDGGSHPHGGVLGVVNGRKSNFDKCGLHGFVVPLFGASYGDRKNVDWAKWGEG
jgi:hypothetical protein